jgi:MFS family permease
MGFRVVGRLLLAQGFSSIGTSMSTIALAVMVYSITGSVLQMGGVMAASTLPLVVMAWLGGAFLDRYSARNVMVFADAARAVLIFAMPFLAAEAIGLVYLVAALIGMFTALFNPGQVKLIGELIPRDNLVKVNSYVSVCRDGAELVGYPIGGVIAYLSGVTIFGLAITGYTLAFIVDAASYAVSAALLIGLPRGVAGAGAVPRFGALVAESPRVLGRLWRQPFLRTNLLLAVFAAGAVMMYVPNSYGLALEVFDRGSLGLASLEVFVAVGLIAGGLIFSRARLRQDKNGYVFMAVGAAGLCLLAVGFSPLFWLSVVVIGIGGVANVGMVVPSITMYQEIPTSPDKGRIIALRTSFGQLGATAGFLVGGVVGAKIGIQQAFLVAGAAAIVIGLLIYVPYRLNANRRARVAWQTATLAGATRTTARKMAEDAAYTGVMASAGPGGPVGPVWAAAPTEPALDSTGGD